MKGLNCAAYHWKIGDNVRRIRMLAGMTQEELAEQAELSVKGIQKVEAGQSGIQIQTLIKIAFALEIPLEQLINSNNENEHFKNQKEVYERIMRNRPNKEIQFAIAAIESLLQLKDEYLN